MIRILRKTKVLKPLQDKKGNTVIVVLCLMTTAVAAFQISLFQSVSVGNTVKNARILSARDAIESQIRTYAALGTTFRSSLHPSLASNVNPELKNCIFGTGASQCVNGANTPVSLYYPISSTDPSPSSPLQRISGPAAVGSTAEDPVKYDNKGNICPILATTGKVDPGCPYFEVTTTFSAKCAGSAPKCSTADSISVNYSIRAAKEISGSTASAHGTVAMASIEASAMNTTRIKILPSSASAANNNVTVTLIPVITSGFTLEEIKAALINLGLKDNPTTDAIAVAFQQSGITDLSKLPFLAEVGITDPGWMKIVADSGITDPFMAGMLQYTPADWTSTLLAAVVSAVNGLPSNQQTWAIASGLVTDATVAQQINNTVNGMTSDPFRGAGLVFSGAYSDPAKAQSLLNAVSDISVPQVASTIMRYNITDKNLANQIASIVNVIPNKNDAGNMVLAGGGEITKIQAAVNAYLNGGSTPAASGTPIPVAAVTSTPAPLTMSLVPTCTQNCTKVTY